MCLRDPVHPQVGGIPTSSNPNGQGIRVTLSFAGLTDTIKLLNGIVFSIERKSVTSFSMLVME